MVNKCVAAGCSNGPSQLVRLFKFPGIKDAGNVTYSGNYVCNKNFEISEIHRKHVE